MKKNLLFVVLLSVIATTVFSQSIDNSFFDHVKYRGAFGDTDWTSGWSNFDPQNTVYASAKDTINVGDTISMALGSPARNLASFSDAVLQDSFFTPVNYIGAFGQTDWTAGWSNFDPQNTVYPATTTTIAAGEITGNVTWTKDNVYLLNGWVYVTDGATLTIEAGTVIRGDLTNQGALIVERGGKLIAKGTADAPIIFTSNQAAGSRSYGDWGGVILCGKAPINISGGSGTIEGGVRSEFGGTDSEDSSGVLNYVRIEFPGIAFSTNNEINGLTFGGVGSKTSIDYIQVSYSGDDSYEWFGGTVNCKHLIAYRGWDDDFDTDNGYSGMVQFGVSLRDPDIADQSKSNSFESDNDATGSTNTPFTSAVFCNMSSFGPLVSSTTSINSLYQCAMHLRRSTKLKIYNSVFAGWPKGLLIDGAQTETNLNNGDLVLKNVVMTGMTTNFNVASTTSLTATTLESWFDASGKNNATYASNATLKMNDPFTLTAPDFRPCGTYLLNGWVYVVNGTTCAINPGVVIRGDLTKQGALIVERGGKLIAKGTASQPIVFTSNQAVGSRTYGDWGGVILCGKAPINVSGGSGTIEGGVRSQFGGTDSADSSGVLNYVRIEFPGIAFSTNNEINGLTFGGVGSKTSIDYIQVSYSGDDSYEWFGGTVNCKHLIAYRGWDDDFDTDNGFSGMVQYGVSLRDPDIADQSKSNSFESDNDATGSTNTPFTSAVFSNISSFGPLVTSTTSINSLYQCAMHLRRSTKLKIYNTIFAGWPKGLLIDGAQTETNLNNGELILKNDVMSGMTTNFNVASTTSLTATTLQTWYSTSAYSNTLYTNNSSLNITDPFTLTAPNFLPTSSSAMLSGSYWDSSTGIVSATASASALSIYPNPAVSDVNVVLPDFDGNTVITVNDLTGKMLMSKTVSGSTLETINVSSLNQGMYMVIVRQGASIYTQKLFVK